ncbi:MAG: hypothetical protein K9K37_07885 [Desulfocapsa sp.]|nr:hypothetical protein [Desulfocapsa sp.]
MSFFDFIDRELKSQPCDSAQQTENIKVTSNNSRDGNLNNWQHRPKQEKLNFLKPCSLCSGREFISKPQGGFFCTQCQPGAVGIPVTAGGEREVPVSTDEPALFPANDKGSAKPDRRNKEKQNQQANFKAAIPWIQTHLEELQATGWTRPALFRRGKHKWPIGNWGLAWVAPWNRDNLKIAIGVEGKLIFIFSSSGRRIAQTAIPQQYTTRRTRKEQRL